MLDCTELYIYLFIYLLAALEFELRASHLRSRCLLLLKPFHQSPGIVLIPEDNQKTMSKEERFEGVVLKE
jgi:hypothetical protein